MKSPKKDKAFKAFRSVDFNWAIRLEDIWQTPPGDVPELHQKARAELLDEIERLQRQHDDASPLGRFILGEAGSGKTHLLGAVRHEVAKKGLGFILIDMTDVRDFWDTVAQGFLNSLQAPYLDGKAQYSFLLTKLVERVPTKRGVGESLQKLSRYRTEQLTKNIQDVLALLKKSFPKQAQMHQDPIRALLCLNSTDFGIANAGMAYLQSLEMDEDLHRALQFQKPREDPKEIVRALSWIVSLAGPSVLAFDQLDPIIHQVGRQNIPTDVEEQNAARTIIDKIGNGLAAIREVTTRTLIVVSCLEASYAALKSEVLESNLDRFHAPIRLQYRPGSDLNRLLIEGRVMSHYKQQDFTPPYSTWPFTPEAIQGLRGQSPRAIFRLCESHRRRCVEKGSVDELTSFEAAPTKVDVPSDDQFNYLDQQLQQNRAEAALDTLCDEKTEDERLAPLYQTALQCLVYENESRLPKNVTAIVEREFGGGPKTKPLHARLRIQFQDEGDREEHYCVRVLLKKHHAAYKSRLKAAITQSGIEKKITFRRLTVVRIGSLPGGAMTEKMTKQFQDLGGQFHRPNDDELRTLYALMKMADARFPQWESWLRSRQPVTKLGLGHTLAPGSLFDKAQPNVKPSATTPAVASQERAVPAAPVLPREKPLPQAEKSKGEGSPGIMLGNRLVGDELKQPLHLPIDLLEKHTFVVAGAGSGKTVLLKHLIEQAALNGIPSIVIDGANDLAALGEPWPEAGVLGDEAQSRAAEYFQNAEVIIWTPGVERGNPLQLNPLPDFSAVRDDPVALEESIMVAVDGLTELVAVGSAAIVEKKTGVLRSILGYFAKEGGGTLDSLIALLQEPPRDALLGIDKEEKLARDMSDMLTVRRQNNPLLRSTGTALDPAALFGDQVPNGKTRVSVINLAGLGSPASQQQFLNQLAMTLFDWAKKNPNPPGRAMRGLFVMDEAKDFIPSRTTSVCKRSLMRCAAQLRKYHIGMLFATQSPKDLENTIVQNCSTHFYGKVSSPAAIGTVKELMSLKGGSGHDISNLPKGVFYVHNADADCRTPTKIKIPLCLTHHRANPPTPDEVIAMAQKNRVQID